MSCIHIFYLQFLYICTCSSMFFFNESVFTFNMVCVLYIYFFLFNKIILFLFVVIFLNIVESGIKHHKTKPKKQLKNSISTKNILIQQHVH
jgi:hypothetical protein